MITISSYIQNADKAKEVHTYILKYFKNNAVTGKITTCSQYQTFCSNIDNTKADIYIIDFEDMETGIKLAKQIRRKSIIPAIIMIDVSKTSVNKLLLMRPSGILNGGWTVHNLLVVIANVISELSAMNLYFPIKTRNITKRIPYSDIVYFESDAHKVNVWLNDSMHPCCITSKLDIVQIDIPDYFVRCHKSYIVNLNYVVALDINLKAFVLLSNKKIYISRRMYTDVMLKYEAFIQFKRDI